MLNARPRSPWKPAYSPVMDDFQRKCRSDENKRDFQKAIGYYLSLSSCIEQCKAAVKYPPNGLPALFNGAGGTGKAFLSRLMYEYAVNERVIGTAGAASLPPYITVDCSEYAQNEEKFAISLCGSEDEKAGLQRQTAASFSLMKLTGFHFQDRN